MNYKKSKFSLIFRSISLLLIQAFLLLDISWAAGGEISVANYDSETSTLAPRMNLSAKGVSDTYLYLLEKSKKMNDIAPPVQEQPLKKSEQTETMNRRTFFKKMAGAAVLLTGIDGAMPAQTQARNMEVDLRDLVVSFDSDVTKAELDKYIMIIESQGFKESYSIEKNNAGTSIRIQGLFHLNAEKLSHTFNAQAKVRGLSRDFEIKPSSAGWDESITYSGMRTFANKVADISSELGFGQINTSELVGLYEGITWVESKFHQWEKDILGRIKPVKSYTNAIGVTQVIESQAVKQIAQWILTDKGGISRYSEIMNELERMISSGSEKVKKTLSQNREFIEETQEQASFNVYDDFRSYNTAELGSAQKKQIIRRIHRKINSNPKLIGVNLYYALAAWEYLDKKKGFKAEVTRDIAKSMGQIAKNLTRTKDKIEVPLIETGPGAYKPDNFEDAGLQFQRDYFRLNVLYEMIGPKQIAAILKGDGDKRFDRMMSYLTRQMMSKKGNQKLGYTYLTLNWDRYRRLELRKNKNNEYEFAERPLSYFQNTSNGFSVSLAAAAAYNAGTGVVDTALLNFGDAVDNNGIPLWIKNMIGVNPRNIREPINYLRAFLEDRFNNTGELSPEERNVKNKLIAERYKRLYKVEDRLLENRKLISKKGVKMYEDYERLDLFDHKLATLLARVAGSDYVDSFLRSHGEGRGIGAQWENEIFSRTTPTFDIIASVLADENSPGYEDAVSLKQYLLQKQFGSSVAYLDERVGYFKQREQTRVAGIELAKKRVKEQEWQKTLAFIKSWALRSAVGAASIAAAGGVIWIMRRRIKQGKKAVPPLMYRVPLRALGWIGYVTGQVFFIGIKIIKGAVKFIFKSNVQKRPRINKYRGVLDDQKVVRNNRYNQSGNNRLINFIRKVRNRRSGNRFRLMILVPLLTLQLGSFFNPGISQSADTLLQFTQTPEITEYKNEHTVNIIPGTNIEINAHFGIKDGRHNNVLGDWAEGIIKGTIQPEADIVRFDWHSDDLAAVMSADLDQWAGIKNLKTDQEKITAAREVAANLRIDAFNYPAYLDGPTGRPILGTTYWVHQNEEWQGAVKPQNVALTSGAMVVTDKPEDYPNERKFTRYNLNIEQLSNNNAVRIKDGFILDFDLDYFVLHREDINWDYMNELLNSSNESSQKIAKSMLKTVQYQPSRQQIQKNIDQVIAQLKKLAGQGIRPSIIDIAESPNFTPDQDAQWVRKQLIKGLESVYQNYEQRNVKAEIIDTLSFNFTGISKGSNLSSSADGSGSADTESENHLVGGQQRTSFARKIINFAANSGSLREKLSSAAFFVGISLAQFVNPSSGFADSLASNQALINTGSSYVNTFIAALIVGAVLIISKKIIQRVDGIIRSVKNRKIIEGITLDKSFKNQFVVDVEMSKQEIIEAVIQNREQWHGVKTPIIASEIIPELNRSGLDSKLVKTISRNIDRLLDNSVASVYRQAIENKLYKLSAKIPQEQINEDITNVLDTLFAQDFELETVEKIDEICGYLLENYVDNPDTRQEIDSRLKRVFYEQGLKKTEAIEIVNEIKGILGNFNNSLPIHIVYILSNLILNNTRGFSEYLTDSSVRIMINIIEQPESAKRYLAVEVLDNGTGIDKNTLQDIFSKNITASKGRKEYGRAVLASYIKSLYQTGQGILNDLNGFIIVETSTVSGESFIMNNLGDTPELLQIDKEKNIVRGTKFQLYVPLDASESGTEASTGQIAKEVIPEHIELEDTLGGEAGLEYKFKNKQLDTVVFVNVDLMRLTTQYVAKKNVNLLLDVLEKELKSVIKEMGAENAARLRRGEDEFVLAINSRGNKQLAIDIAARIKANVQNAKFAVASIGTDTLAPERIAEIESIGCGIDKIGKHNIIIVAEKAGGNTGRACIQDFLDRVDVITSFKNQEIPQVNTLSIERSWLNRSVVANEVSFTLSIGLATTAEINEAEGQTAYEKTRNLAAQRKDKSKEIFKKLGDGHIESNSAFEHSGASGESEQAIKPQADIDKVLVNNPSISEPGESLQEYNAYAAVEQLDNLNISWQQNKQQIDALAIDQGIISFLGMISPRSSEFSDKDTLLKPGQSI